MTLESAGQVKSHGIIGMPWLWSKTFEEETHDPRSKADKATNTIIAILSLAMYVQECQRGAVHFIDLRKRRLPLLDLRP